MEIITKFNIGQYVYVVNDYDYALYYREVTEIKITGKGIQYKCNNSNNHCEKGDHRIVDEKFLFLTLQDAADFLLKKNRR